MIAHLRFSGAAIALAMILGCGTAAPPATDGQSVSVSELRTILRESEQIQRQAVSKLQEEFKDLADKTRAFEEARAIKESQAETKLLEFGRKFDELNQRLDESSQRLNTLTEQVNKLPIALKLQMRVPHRIEGTLEEALAAISKWTMIPIRFEGSDLSEAGIPKIHQVELTGGDAPARKLLADALLQTNLNPVTSLADPTLNVVYVIQNAGDLGNESLVITSRKRAAERGKLPDEFVVKK